MDCLLREIYFLRKEIYGKNEVIKEFVNNDKKNVNIDTPNRDKHEVFQIIKKSMYLTLVSLHHRNFFKDTVRVDASNNILTKENRNVDKINKIGMEKAEKRRRKP